MLCEITKVNSISLFHYFQEKGYKGNKEKFDKELFNNGNNYQRTYVYESEGKILSYIQYGKDKNGNGYIRLFNYEKDFEYAGNEVLFRASTYFYIFHLKAYFNISNTELDKVFIDNFDSNNLEIIKDFNIEYNFNEFPILSQLTQ